MKPVGGSARRKASRIRPAKAGRSLALRDGGLLRLTREPGGEALEVIGSDGAVRLEVLLTASGAVLRLAGSRVVLEAEGTLDVRCTRFEVNAESIALDASGDVSLSAGRGMAFTAGHDASVSAQAVTIAARRGDVALVANDDVALDGERVLLNCPTDEEVERRREKAASLKDRLALPFRSPGSPRRLRPSAPVDEGAE